MRKLLLILFLFIAALSFANKSWYVDQNGTGIGNCGPATVAMIISYSKNIHIPVQLIRNEIGYKNPDGSTDFDELSGVLKHYNASYYKADIETKEAMDKLLNRHHIILILVDMSNIPNKSGYTEGHYLILSGIQGKDYEVQDPLNGSDVHYNADLIWSSMKTRDVFVATGPDHIKAISVFGAIARILIIVDISAIVIPKKLLPC